MMNIHQMVLSQGPTLFFSLHDVPAQKPYTEDFYVGDNILVQVNEILDVINGTVHGGDPMTSGWMDGWIDWWMGGWRSRRMDGWRDDLQETRFSVQNNINLNAFTLLSSKPSYIHWKLCNAILPLINNGSYEASDLKGTATTTKKEHASSLDIPH